MIKSMQQQLLGNSIKQLLKAQSTLEKMRNNLFGRNAKPKAGSTSTATTSAKKPVEKPQAKNITLHVPNVFKKGDSVLLMSASHRGDMYHFRAALQVENFSVILYDSNHDDPKKPKTKDLEDYLAESVLKRGKHIFIVPWDYNTLHGRTEPGSIAGCFLDGQKYNKDAQKLMNLELSTYSEKASTQIIASAPNRLQDVVNGMTILGNTMNGNKCPDFKELSAKFPKVSEGFVNLWAGWTEAGVKAGKNAILLMYRDTGTRDPAPVETMGVYPELDNGAATEEIERIVGEISENNKTLTVFTCGLAGSGIGRYWEALDNLNPKKTEISKRDFEAYFLKWSYKNNYFMMATGFRSGPLDLFTFMGIPTVSIGLRNLMGEPRHQMLADERFKRVNVQYDQPRHKVTAAVISKRWKTPPEPGQTTFGSPFWDDDFRPPQDAKAKRDIPQNKKGDQMQNPRTFAPFDRVVVKTGYMIALQKYMEWGQTISSLKKTLPCTVTTSDARFCYPFKSFGNQTVLTKYFDDNEKFDNGDVTRVQRKLGQASETLQLSEPMFNKYKDDYNNDWNKIVDLIKNERVLGRQANNTGNPWTRKLRI